MARTSKKKRADFAAHLRNIAKICHNPMTGRQTSDLQRPNRNEHRRENSKTHQNADARPAHAKKPRNCVRRFCAFFNTIIMAMPKLSANAFPRLAATFSAYFLPARLHEFESADSANPRGWGILGRNASPRYQTRSVFLGCLGCPWNSFTRPAILIGRSWSNYVAIFDEERRHLGHLVLQSQSATVTRYCTPGPAMTNRAGTAQGTQLEWPGFTCFCSFFLWFYTIQTELLH